MKSKLTIPLAIASAAFVAAGGYVHLREWLDTYRNVPSSVPGAEVVTVGFPVTAGLSLVAVLVILGTAVLRPAWLRLVAVASLVWQAASIGALVISREGSLLGWMEPTYTPGAEQILAVEIGAIVCLAALLGLDALERRSGEWRTVSAA